MAWLSATLAFATTMLVFALFVSSIVEALHRVFGLRHQGMRLTLEALYENVIEQRVRAADPHSTLDAATFADIIMTNRPLAGGAARPAGRVGRLVRWLTRGGASTNIPTEIFTQRLVDSRMVEVAEALSDTFVQNVAQQYEAYGKEISEFFRARAQLLSLLVAFVLAFAFQVHPHALVTAYLGDPGLAERVIARIDSQGAWLQRIEQIAAGASPAAPAGDASAAPADGTAELRAALAELQKETGRVAEAAAALAKAGVPLGWSEVASCADAARWTQPCWPAGGAVMSWS
ncbi:hypothetical protein EJC49_03250, partial [Aquibium carbonis]